MTMKNKIAVRILGQDHYLVSTDDTEYVQQVAKMVDDRMQAILKGNSSISYTKIAILTALNLADDLTKARKKVEELKIVSKPPKVEMSETKKQIHELAKHVNEAEYIYDNVLSELEMIKSSRKDQEAMMRSLTNRLQVLCGDMEDEDEALRRATSRIEELEEKLQDRENELQEYIRVFDELENEQLMETTIYEDEILYEDDIEE